MADKLELKHYSQLANAQGLFELPRTFWEDVEQIYIGATRDNIAKGKQARSGNIKRNKAATLERKRRQGKPLLSLVDDKHRFIQPGRSSWGAVEWFARGTGFLFGAINAELKKLQGYTGAKGYTGYLGIGREGQRAVRGLLREQLKRELKRIARSRAKKVSR